MTPQISLAHLARPECEQDHGALFLGNGERTRTASTSRGRKNDPLYRARRTLHTGAGLLTDKQAARLTAMFSIDEHVEIEVTWGSDAIIRPYARTGSGTQLSERLRARQKVRIEAHKLHPKLHHSSC
jgi:hypothetical protein